MSISPTNNINYSVSPTGDPAYLEMEASLSKWVKEADHSVDKSKGRGREKAKNRILECYLDKTSSLNLNNLWLFSLPPEIGKLTHLRDLYAEGNGIITLPPEIGNLCQIKNLYLGQNKLNTLPPELGELNQLEVLNLRMNKLIILPTEIGNLIHLIELNLYDNQLTQLSFEICNCSSLQFLCITGCTELTELPNEILSLPRYCEVSISNTGLSKTVLRRLHDVSNSFLFPGPRFLFPKNNLSHGLKSKEEYINDLYAYAHGKVFANVDQKVINFSQLTPDKDYEAALTTWLGRLSDMADFRNGGDARQKVALTTLSFLKMANDNPEFCKEFYPIIWDAAGTCGDRMSLYFFKLDMAYQKAALDLNNPQEVAKFLRTEIALKELETFAQNKLSTLYDKKEELETYLAYPIRLKERLGLNFQVDEMLNHRQSHVTDADINNAGDILEPLLNDKNEFAMFLIGNPLWGKILDNNCSKELKEIETKVGELLDAEKYNEARLVRYKLLKNLTMELLG